MTGRYYVRATKLAGLQQIAARRGGDLASLMRATGLDPVALKQPDTAVDYGKVCKLLHRCAETWDMPDIGLRMIDHQRIDFLGPVALVVRMEPTVRDVFRAIAKNIVLHSNATLVAVEEKGGTASAILHHHPGVEVGRESTELVMAQGKLVLETVLGARIKLFEVSFTFERGSSAPVIARHFGCNVRYGAERNAICFDAALLDLPTQKSDRAYHPLIRRYLSTSRSEAAHDPVEDARHEIARQMEFGRCTLNGVAQSLRMTPRSLQRRLGSSGATFRGLVDDWRRDRALSLVTTTRLPLSEVSAALGYSEQAVFTQAFRRWYGRAPLRVRTEWLAGGV